MARKEVSTSNMFSKNSSDLFPLFSNPSGSSSIAELACMSPKGTLEYEFIMCMVILELLD